MGAGGSSGRAAPVYSLGRVLVAGDEMASGSAVRECLSSAGFETEACDSREVLIAFERVIPDLVVITARLDTSHTVAVCQWIRSRCSVPLVVISGSPRLDPVDVLTRGADLVLRSSVGERELVARVRGLLRRRPPRLTVRQPAWSFGDIALDREQRQLQLPGSMLQLEGREFHLMEMLMRGGPKLSARRALRETLREDDAGLDGLVRRLRERLEAVEGWRRIVTVRGVGFRVLEERPGSVDAAAIPTLPVIDLRAAEMELIDQRGETSLDESMRVISSSTGVVG